MITARGEETSGCHRLLVRQPNYQNMRTVRHTSRQWKVRDAALGAYFCFANAAVMPRHIATSCLHANGSRTSSLTVRGFEHAFVLQLL
jgi:hypothetical protein